MLPQYKSENSHGFWGTRQTQSVPAFLSLFIMPPRLGKSSSRRKAASLAFIRLRGASFQPSGTHRNSHFWRTFMNFNDATVPEIAAVCEDSAETHGSHRSLNLHPKWKAKRAEILERDGHKCVNCSRSDELEVHHRMYVYSVARRKFLNPWEYRNDFLLTLCRRCHQRGHKMYKVPHYLCE